MVKEKRCKGTGKAKGHGCGEMVPQEMYGKANRVYGLGKSCGCWQSWLLTTKEGDSYIKKVSIKAKEKTKREQDKERRKRNKEVKRSLMSKDQYRSKVLQPVLNKIAREIDKGCPCIATNNYGKENGGHYISVGSNVTISMNLHNIHIQCFESNHYKSGDTVNYRAGIIERYGVTYMRFMDSLQACPALHKTKDELIEVKKKASKLLKFIEEKNKEESLPRSAEARIALRNHVNKELRLYPFTYSEF